MTELTKVQKVLAAIETIEELQADPVTAAKAYSPEQLRGIVRMYRGGSER